MDNHRSRPASFEYECPCGRTTVVVICPDSGPDVAGALHRMENTMATTRDEIVAKLDELKKDTQRIIAKLRAALEAQNLDDIGAAIDELDGTVEAADPETTEPPAFP